MYDNNNFPKNMNYDMANANSDNSTEKIRDVQNNANLYSQGTAPNLHRDNHLGKGLGANDLSNSKNGRNKNSNSASSKNATKVNQDNHANLKNNLSSKNSKGSNYNPLNNNDGLGKQRAAKLARDKSTIMRNTLSNITRNKNLSMKEKIENIAAGLASAKNPLLGKLLSSGLEKKNELKRKKEEGNEGGYENFKISYQVVLALSILAVPAFTLLIFVALLIPSSQIFLSANTLGQANDVKDAEADTNINNVKSEDKLSEDILDENSDSNSNNVSYIFDIFLDDKNNPNSHYEFTAKKQEASLADLRDFYPEIIDYTGDEYNQNDVYKFFRKLYNIYNYYLDQGVELDIPLIMSVLELQSSDMAVIFKANTVDFDEEDTDVFSVDKDWSSYKPTKNNSAHDIEVLAQGMVKEGTTDSTEDNTSTSTEVSKTGKEAIDKMTEIALQEAEEVHEGGEKYWSWFGFNYRDEWCAMFVSWLFNQVDGLDKYIIKSAAATYIVRDSTNNGYGTWYEDECTDSSTVPQAGDVIVFDPWVDGTYTPYPYHGNDKFYSSHIGYVYKVDDTYVYTVEGNSGDIVRMKQYDRKKHCGTFGIQGINGYFRPNY